MAAAPEIQPLLRILEKDLEEMTPEERSCPAHAPRTVRQIRAMITAYTLLGLVACRRHTTKTTKEPCSHHSTK